MVRRVLLTSLVFGLVACGDSTGLEDIAGIYTLQTIDGEGLPAVTSEIDDPVLVEVTAGSVTLNQNLTCIFSSTTRIQVDGTVTLNVNAFECAYTFSNGVIILTPTEFSGGTASGLIGGPTLTLIDDQDGTIFVFEK